MLGWGLVKMLDCRWEDELGLKWLKGLEGGEIEGMFCFGDFGLIGLGKFDEV